MREQMVGEDRTYHLLVACSSQGLLAHLHGDDNQDEKLDAVLGDHLVLVEAESQVERQHMDLGCKPGGQHMDLLQVLVKLEDVLHQMLRMGQRADNNHLAEVHHTGHQLVVGILVVHHVLVVDSSMDSQAAEHLGVHRSRQVEVPHHSSLVVVGRLHNHPEVDSTRSVDSLAVVHELAFGR